MPVNEHEHEYECDACGKTFDSREDLVEHVREVGQTE